MSSDLMELWLNKATNPLQITEDWEAIVGFCDLVNKEINGPQTAVRLLVHKIQSPQEKESLYALTALETCVKNCGARFHQEIGKFRFINEIIKLVSPKYLGNHTTFKVKQKSIELLYHWSQNMPQEPKIKEAYQMLRKQNIVKQDPVYINEIPSEATAATATPKPETPNSIFDEDKSKLLSTLLKSKNAEDLQAANRLIKNMVKQDAERTEKQSLRTQQLDTLLNSVKLLSDMLYNYHNTNSSSSDKEIMKELFDNIEKQRPALFKMANESDEKDVNIIGEILKVNDRALEVIAQYDQIVNKTDVGNLLIIEQSEENCSTDLALALASSSNTSTNGTQYKDELSDLFSSPQISNGTANKENVGGKSHAMDLLDIFSTSSNQLNQMPIIPLSSNKPTLNASSVNDKQLSTNTATSIATTKDPFHFGQNVLVDVLSNSGLKPMTLNNIHVKPSLNELKTQIDTSSSNQNKVNHVDSLKSTIPNFSYDDDVLLLDNNGSVFEPKIDNTDPLKDVFVPVDKIEIGVTDPIQLYDHQGLKVLLHACLNRPKSNVNVIVGSFVSTSRVPINNIKLKLIGEKDNSVKDQPASGMTLVAYNPILPSPSLSQIFAINNPLVGIVKLKSILDFQINSTIVHEEKEFNISFA